MEIKTQKSGKRTSKRHKISRMFASGSKTNYSKYLAIDFLKQYNTRILIDNCRNV